MIYKCATINCRSGYRGEKQDRKVAFHSFPLEDKHLLQTWLKRLARILCKIMYQQNILNFVLFILSSKIFSLTQLIKKDGEKEKEKHHL